jgi:hypothetical protein
MSPRARCDNATDDLKTDRLGDIVESELLVETAWHARK